MAKVFSEEEIRRARQTDLVSYLQRENERAREQGMVEPYVLQREGKQYRLKGYGGLLIHRNMFNQRSTGIGGNTLDFLMKIEKKPFHEAVGLLLSDQGRLQRVEVSEQTKPRVEPFVLPEPNPSFRRVIAYLTKTRGIDAEILLSEIKRGNIYEDAKYHNVVFVGRDQNGEPRWAQKRSTLSKVKFVVDQAGSDARHPYFYGVKGEKTVVVVESPIEALSYATLLKLHQKDPTQTAILPLGGVHDTALANYLREHPSVQNIILALNNDRAEKPNEIKGREASELIRTKYERMGYYVKVIFPTGKDWNDDLRALRFEELQKKQEPIHDRGVEEQIRQYAKLKARQRMEARGLSLGNHQRRVRGR